jgi:hypothetical protein
MFNGIILADDAVFCAGPDSKGCIDRALLRYLRHLFHSHRSPPNLRYVPT